MTSSPGSDFQALKQEIRKAAQARRARLPDREQRSRQINARLVALPEFQAARSIAFYISVRSEAQTRPALQAALAAGKKVVTPYCEDGRLRLVRIENEAELEIGAYQIPEPAAAIRGLPERAVSAAELDMIVVPGIAFDRDGNRLGHGAGYYDKLLAEVGPATKLVALAFECQLVDRVPTQSHDVRMHRIVTEAEVIDV